MFPVTNYYQASTYDLSTWRRSMGRNQVLFYADNWPIKALPFVNNSLFDSVQLTTDNPRKLIMMPLWVLMFLAVAAAAPLDDDDDKIVGGYECTPHSQPWQVLFTYNGGNWCGGSLISPRWIISAAHCYQPPKTLVALLGEHDLKKKEGTEQHIQVEAAYKHFSYKDEAYDHDIMLVKLAKPAQYNQYVQPIPVARSCPTDGAKCLVSGYGNLLAYNTRYPDQLQCLDLPILSDSSCKASYPRMISENMFCAGFLEGEKDSCKGDSGGPLICSGELYGVVSWGRYCARKNSPGVYAKVCNYLDWIKNITENN
uniref:Peptidase S1 domain-containing protein n=1 Tax=Xenopus tropicalis TaxID=8364 RepID=K9J8A1_XENTR